MFISCETLMITLKIKSFKWEFKVARMSFRTSSASINDTARKYRNMEQVSCSIMRKEWELVTLLRLIECDCWRSGHWTAAYICVWMCVQIKRLDEITLQALFVLVISLIINSTKTHCNVKSKNTALPQAFPHGFILFFIQAHYCSSRK